MFSIHTGDFAMFEGYTSADAQEKLKIDPRLFAPHITSEIRERHENGYIKALVCAETQMMPICPTCHGHMMRKEIAWQTRYDVCALPEALINRTRAEKEYVALRHCYGRVAKLTVHMNGNAPTKLMANTAIFPQRRVPLRRTADGPLLFPVLEDLSETILVHFSGPGAEPTVNGNLVPSWMVVRRENIRDAFASLFKSNPRSYGHLEFNEAHPLHWTACIYTDNAGGATVASPDLERVSTEERDIFVDQQEDTRTPLNPGQREAQFVLNNTPPQAVRATPVNAAERVERSKTLANEFTENELNLVEKFPWLFPLGIFDAKGLYFNSAVRHLLKYYDRRFESERMFVFYVFNRGARHAVVGNTARADRKEVEKLGARLNDPQFIEVLSRATEKLARGEDLTAVGKAALMYLEKVLKLSEGSRPFSYSDLNRGKLHLHSMFRAKGMPLLFITFAPVPGESELGLSMCLSSSDYKVYETMSFPQRLSAVYGHPASAASFFDFIVKSFIKIALGVKHKSTAQFDENPLGIFGKTEAYHATVECQSRSLLHAHFLVWTSLTPSEVTELVRKGMMKEWCRCLERIVQTELPPEPHALAAKVPYEEVPSPGLSKDTPLAIPRVTFLQNLQHLKRANGFDLEGFHTFLKYQRHEHKSTCAKGHSWVCRLGFSRPHSKGTGLFEILTAKEFKMLCDNGVLDAEMARLFEKRNTVYIRELGSEEAAGVFPCSLHYKCSCEDPFCLAEAGAYGFLTKRFDVVHEGVNYSNNSIAETNLCLAACLQCNSNVSVLHSAEQAAAAAKYVVSYLCKGEGTIRLAKAGLNKLRNSAWDKEDNLQGRKLINTLSCACIGGQELASSIAAHCCLGNCRYYDSHNKHYIYVHRELRGLKEGDPVESSPDVSDSESSLADSRSSLSTIGSINAPEPDSGRTSPVRSTFVRANVLVEVRSDEQVSYNEEIGVTSRPHAGESTWSVTSDRELYAARPACLENLAFLDFVCLFQLAKKSKPKDGAEVKDGEREGRQVLKNAEFPLVHTHLLSATHVLKLRTFACVPVLAGGNPPRCPDASETSAIAQAQRRTWAQCWSYLLIPWRKLEWAAEDRNFEFVRSAVLGCLRKDIAIIARTTIGTPCPVTITLRHTLAHFCVRTTAGLSSSPQCRTALNGLRMSNADVLASDILQKEKQIGHDAADDYLIEDGVPVQSSVEERIIDVLGSRASDHTVPLAPRQLVFKKNALPYDLDSIKQQAKFLHTPQATEQPNLTDGQSKTDVHKLLMDALRATGATLNSQQSSAANTVLDAISCEVAGDRAPSNHGLFWIEGGAGSGKTFTTNCILKACATVLGASAVGAAAFQGVTAQNLWHRGRTLHNVFGLKGRGALKGEDGNNSTPTNISVNETLKALKLLVIDEVGMVPAELFLHMDESLRNARNDSRPFGGCIILCLGDFFQLEPVAGNSLLKAYYTDKNVRALWGLVLRMLPSSNMRSGTCARLSRLVSKVRNAPTLDPNLLNCIQQIGAIDFSDPDLITLHATNEARHAAGYHLIHNYSKTSGNALYLWRMPILSSSFDSRMLQRLRGYVPALTQTFCAGGRMVIDSNLCTELGLCNGTIGYYVSIHFGSKSETDSVSKVDAVDNIVRLPEGVLPSRVVIGVEREPPACSVQWETIEMNGKTLWLAPLAMTKREVDAPRKMIPNKANAKSGAANSQGHKKCEQFASAKLRCLAFPCSQGYAFTFHRIQGQTPNKVALDLSPGPGRIYWESVCVGLTRVRAFDNLRLISVFDNSASALQGLSPNPHCANYYLPQAWSEVANSSGCTRLYCSTRDGEIHKKSVRRVVTTDLSLAPSRIMFPIATERVTHFSATARIMQAMGLRITRACTDNMAAHCLMTWQTELLATPPESSSLAKKPKIRIPSEAIGLCKPPSVTELFSHLCLSLPTLSRTMLDLTVCTANSDELKTKLLSPPHTECFWVSHISTNHFAGKRFDVGTSSYSPVAALRCAAPTSHAKSSPFVSDKFEAICAGESDSWWLHSDGASGPRKVSVAVMAHIIHVFYRRYPGRKPDITNLSDAVVN